MVRPLKIRPLGEHALTLSRVLRAIELDPQLSRLRKTKVVRALRGAVALLHQALSASESK